ncbi:MULTISPECIES: O-methyltransferase [unclassified Halomonas]|uniref:O-methyltransferase n=1 Tax=unclassified Halomonas TaxID=2609666 RepID=UPI0009905044|nr:MULTISPECIES: class I SAM-dependent methyltransferase [unclassified Halomonas]AQU85108.1 methyltransferase [Halomonas sp. 'Soap Lake \
MSEALRELLIELEQFGQENDAAISDRPRRMLNITRDTGEFLSVLAQAMNAQCILEIGTSNGYSTLWLAQAVHNIGGLVTTVEQSDFKIELAAKNFARSGLSEFITQHHGEAGELLESMADANVDLLFLDSKRSEYVPWWPNIKRVLRKGGLIVVDNATSHADEMTTFMTLVSADPDFTTCTVPVGNGQFLATLSHRT